MKASLITAFLLPLLALASPYLPTDPPANIEVTARHPGREHVDKLPMQAAGRAFWLGGSPATYCPEIVGDNCPPGNATVILGLNSLVSSDLSRAKFQCISLNCPTDNQI